MWRIDSIVWRAGRKKLPPVEKKQQITVHLSQQELDFIDRYEGKNRSERLRKLIQELINKNIQTWKIKL